MAIGRVSGRWTLSRLATDLALIAAAVPIALKLIVPADRRPSCALTPENEAMALGLAFLVLRASWVALKWSNDLLEREFAGPAKPPSDYREV